MPILFYAKALLWPELARLDLKRDFFFFFFCNGVSEDFAGVGRDLGGAADVATVSRFLDS